MGDRTYKNSLDDGYTTYYEDGTTSKTYKNTFDNGYTTYHSNGDVSNTYKNVFDDGYTTFQEKASPDSKHGGLLLAIIMGSLSILLILALFFGISIVFLKDIKPTVAFGSIVILMVIWKIIVTENNKEIVDSIFTFIRDILFFVTCKFAFSDFSATSFLVWFVCIFVMISLYAYIPGNKNCKGGNDRFDDATLFLHYFRPVIAWLSPIIIFLIGTGHPQRALITSIVVLAILVVPSFVSIVANIFFSKKRKN